MAEILLAFKAGRAYRREGSNIVDPSPVKGAIILQNSSDDGLLHFIWKNRESNEIEEDLILFPSDAEFVKVSGRTYVLKFSSSNQRHFFWMQDASDARDEEFVNNVNGRLQDPDFRPVWNTTNAPSSQAPSAPPASSQTGLPLPTPEQIARFVEALGRGGSAPAQQREYSLAGILTPASLNTLLADRPELIEALYPHLPPDLPVRPSPEVVQQIVNSPQFRSAVQTMDTAFQGGVLGGLVREMGLPEEAGTSLEAFLQAIEAQARQNSAPADSMDTE